MNLLVHFYESSKSPEINCHVNLSIDVSLFDTDTQTYIFLFLICERAKLPGMFRDRKRRRLWLPNSLWNTQGSCWSLWFLFDSLFQKGGGWGEAGCEENRTPRSSWLWAEGEEGKPGQQALPPVVSCCPEGALALGPAWRHCAALLPLAWPALA